MASLVTAARYRSVTLDTSSAEATVTAALERAEALVEEYLRRPLASTSRTETVRFAGDGRVYPAATPITAVTGGYVIVVGGQAISGAPIDAAPSFPSFGETTYPATATITYTGGYDASSLPETIAEVISWAAHRRLHTGALTSVPAGATAAAVGDVSVSFGPRGASSSGRLTEDDEAALAPWRRRFV